MMINQSTVTVTPATRRRRRRLSQLICANASNETSRRLANKLVMAWYAEMGSECDCDCIEQTAAQSFNSFIDIVNKEY